MTSVLCAYLGSGLPMFVAAVLLSWMPSFFNRYYALGPDKAAAVAAGLVLLVGSSMVVCGVVTDRVARTDPARKWTAAIAFARSR